MAIDNSV